ncbi:MAG: methionyl-tRNA formyltransferase [Reyranellaceae bacterium]
MRIAYMGTSDFAVPALRALAAAGHDIAAVYSQPPRPAGRGQAERRSPVHEAALALGLEVRTPQSLKPPAEIDAFRALDLDAAVVASYGHILRKDFLEAPIFGCLNIHASLLPRWRGAAPIHRAILAGDRQTGVTIIRMDEGLDTGDMLLAEAVPITAASTTPALHDQLADLGARLIVAALDGVLNKSLTPVQQPEEGATYAHKLGREEGRLDWRRPAAELERQVRALAPWPGTYFDLAGERIKVLEAALSLGSGAPGTVQPGGGLSVACGSGALRLVRLQRAGGKAMDAESFRRGFALPDRLPLPDVAAIGAR